MFFAENVDGVNAEKEEEDNRSSEGAAMTRRVKRKVRRDRAYVRVRGRGCGRMLQGEVEECGRELEFGLDLQVDIVMRFGLSV